MKRVPRLNEKSHAQVLEKAGSLITERLWHVVVPEKDSNKVQGQSLENRLFPRATGTAEIH